MGRIIGLLIVVGIMGGMLFAVLVEVSSRKKKPNRGLRAIAKAIVIVGILGFFGTAISALGFLKWLPDTIEWPVFSTRHAAQTSAGGYVVPLTPSGRVQVYDKGLRFIRGWHVNAGGGTFKLQVARGDVIDVYTARGGRHYRFDLGGRLLSKQTYAAREYGTLPSGSRKLTLPFRPWLLPLAHPFYAWALIVAGGILLGILEKGKKRKKRHDPERPMPS